MTSEPCPLTRVSLMLDSSWWIERDPDRPCLRDATPPASLGKLKLVKHGDEMAACAVALPNEPDEPKRRLSAPIWPDCIRRAKVRYRRDFAAGRGAGDGRLSTPCCHTTTASRRTALGHFQTSNCVRTRSVHPLIADMRRLHRHVRFVPEAVI